MIRFIVSTLSKLPTGTFSYRSSGNWVSSSQTYTLASSTCLLAFTDLNGWSSDTIISNETNRFFLQYIMSTCTTQSPVIASVSGETTVTNLNVEYANFTKQADTTSSGFVIDPTTSGDMGHFYIGCTTNFNSFYVTLSNIGNGARTDYQWYYSVLPLGTWKSLTINSITQSSSGLYELPTTMTDWARYNLSTSEAYDPSFIYRQPASYMIMSMQSSQLTMTNDTGLQYVLPFTSSSFSGSSSFLWIGYPIGYTLNTVYMTHLSAYTGFQVSYSYLYCGEHLSII